MNDNIEILMERAQEIYRETRSCYFIITTDGNLWKLKINATEELFVGKLSEVLNKYILKVTTERSNWKNPKNPNHPKKYSYVY